MANSLYSDIGVGWVKTIYTTHTEGWLRVTGAR